MFDFYNNKSNLVLQKVFKMLTKLNYINYDINLKIIIISYHNLDGSKWTVPKNVKANEEPDLYSI
jgi:hypothetical protein